ncbi:CxxH/CxxC protein [Fictibacillus gelatini]|uniref:CxxH/CxxC protein n=1 Tax=Fictibacillus gelatini TaxID=225985 RepID=UPI0009D6BAB9|nr:CxxH/CxxC protein [Fictibacillus gelatini]HWO95637.1 CxxH/CxxC protein [Bacillus sp. (in: firmicutes)]
MIKFCCHTHVDIAMEEIIDECEVAPVVELLTENDKLSTSCSYCEETPIYKVSNE